MERIEKPENWDRMNYGEKLIWLLEKQQELQNAKGST